MAQPHHTQSRKEARRAPPAATEFLQYPAATYTPRPHHTTRISQPIKQAQNGTSRHAARPKPHRNNDTLFANHPSQKTLNTVRSGRSNGLSRTRSRRILCRWILAALVVLAIILTIVFTLKNLDKSRK